ncbi:hypothetical protein K2X96_04115 [Patescibacteria group bacterium]|nr:hypothetical protein [Patescibacteria group bacterium]
MDTHNTKHKEGGMSESVLACIVRDGICPRPRWHFLMKEGVMWTLGGLSIFVGALAIAGLLFELRYAWWDVYEATHDSFFMFMLDALPLVWLILFILFLIPVYHLLRSTSRGYRYSFLLVVCVSLVSTGVMGVGFYSFGMGRFIDERVGAFVPFHNPLLSRERMTWMKPTDGRLAGIIREVPYGDTGFWLEGADGSPYRIEMNVDVNSRLMLRAGEYVRVVGMPTTTPGILEGCIIFMKNDDILRRAHMHEKFETNEEGERKILISRTKECKDVRPYVRFAPLPER